MKLPAASATEGGLSSYEAPALTNLHLSYAGKSPSIPPRSLSSLLRTPSQRVSASVNKNDSDSFSPSEEEVTSTRQKNTLIFWKLLAVIMVASVGLYACVSSLSYKKYNNSLLAQVATQNPHRDVLKSRKICPPLHNLTYPDSLKVCRHYPQPVTYHRKECVCVPVHNFVILSMQRSGSGWFETLLNNHPAISSHGEIFSAGRRPKNFSAIDNSLEQVYNLDWMSSAAKNSCTAAVGVKWMLNQGALEYHREVRYLFQKHRVSVILLLRRNLLRRLVSILANAYDRKMRVLNGKHKSHVHTKEEAKKLASYKPTIKTENLVGNLNKVQRMAEDALRVFNATRKMVFFYEDVAKNKTLLVDVQKFLGVKVRQLSSRQVKIHTKSLSDQIENWNEVKATLNGTRFESLMRDDGYG